jgi:uncharacterized cysteine cluster protein YcgN (CxxCxxCC family)
MSEQGTLREKFWELPLQDLNDKEWEALCDGCARCCLKKIEDEDDGEIYWTRIVCRYLDQDSGGCSCYSRRSELVPDCLNVRTMDIMAQLRWMPASCAYRLRAEGKPLYDWHPLLSGSRAAMEAAGIAVGQQALSEEHVHPDGWEEHIIRWVDS